MINLTAILFLIETLHDQIVAQSCKPRFILNLITINLESFTEIIFGLNQNHSIVWVDIVFPSRTTSTTSQRCVDLCFQNIIIQGTRFICLKFKTQSLSLFSFKDEFDILLLSSSSFFSNKSLSESSDEALIITPFSASS